LDSTYGALVHNARTVIGFYHDGQLSIEHQARLLSKELKDHADYVPTSKLTSLYKTKILPHTMQSGESDAPREVEHPIENSLHTERLLQRLATSATEWSSFSTDAGELTFRGEQGSTATPAPQRTTTFIRPRNRE
jgi:hypothetical protein